MAIALGQLLGAALGRVGVSLMNGLEVGLLVGAAVLVSNNDRVPSLLLPVP